MLTVKGAYALLWQLSEEFEHGVPGWQHSLVVWRTSAPDRVTKTTVLANLCARQLVTGLAIRAVVDVRQRNPRRAFKTRDPRTQLEKKLQERRYDFVADPLPGQPVLAVRNVPLRELRREHLFLSGLTGKSVSPLPRGIRTTLAFSEAVCAASSWWLHESVWTLERNLCVCGREAIALARVRIAPPTSMNSEISVQVSLPWSGRGRRPHWSKEARAVLTRQLRAAGLRVRRFPSEPSIVFASMDVPRRAASVMRVARELSALPSDE